MKRRRKRKNRAAGSYTKRRVVARSRRNPKRRRRSISKRQVMAFNRTHRRNRRRRSSSNPFAKSISLSRPSDLVTAGAGVLVGVFGVKTVLPFLPSSITGNPMFATAAALAIAAGEWWLLSFVSPEFGAAAGLGGIAEAASVALTNYGFPSSRAGRLRTGPVRGSAESDIGCCNRIPQIHDRCNFGLPAALCGSLTAEIQ